MAADHDVAIVGGGPVGLLLACLLAQQGVDVIVAERRGTPGETSRAIGILPPGLRALDAAGIGAAVRGEALAIGRGVAVAGGRALAALPLADVLTLGQVRLEALLRARLASLRPTALQPGTTVRDVDHRGGRVRLRTDRGETSARIAAAADGVRSGIRSQLGIAWRRRPGGGQYLMADGTDRGELGADALLCCAAGGIVESFPMPGRRRRWVALVAPGTPADPARLAAIVRSRTGLEPDLRGAAASTFAARQHGAAALAAGRIVLAGDAAHEVSPIGGQGMNLGLMGAERLAPAILDALAVGRPDFAEYERAQSRAARAAQARARFNMAMGRALPQPARGARDLAARALGTPVLRGAALRAFTMHGL
ncbi:MAG TPA: NAD(P)/FAD-dependent oxidoreductase [Microbacteriaceae bacterium]|nr:NAD(P)/FAD-dependent oxidoreductase [Microbacteriaceae bacterium]